MLASLRSRQQGCRISTAILYIQIFPLSYNTLAYSSVLLHISSFTPFRPSEIATMQVLLLCGLLAGATYVSASPRKITSGNGAALQNINYGAFTQTATYSVANQLGFFTAYSLNVTFLQIPNSTYGYDTLLKGGYDIITGTIDNAVNFRFNSNESLTVTGQLDQGPELAIAAVSHINDITELKGLPLMVDSPVSGYAYIIRKVLSLFGLYLEDGDYSFQVCDAVVGASCFVSLLNLPLGCWLNYHSLR